MKKKISILFIYMVIGLSLSGETRKIDPELWKKDYNK